MLITKNSIQEKNVKRQSPDLNYLRQYISACFFEYGGVTNLDVDILNKVINEIVRTNEALRIRIVEESGIAKQYISEYEKETFKVYILNDDNDTEINKIVKRISEEKMQIMQIMNRKLYAIRIIQNKVETCVSVKTHHIISDAWTLGQIAEQIKEYYLKISNDEEIDIKPSYIEYIKYL